MRILQNMHIHSKLSNCAGDDNTMETIVREAESVGLELIGISDHMDLPDPGRVELIASNFEILKGIETDLRVLIGSEVSFLAPGRPAMSPEEMERFDYIIAATNHYHLSFVEKPRERTGIGFAVHHLMMIESAIELGADIIAHPFLNKYAAGMDIYGQLELYDRSEIRRIMSKAAQKGCAFELNPAHVMSAEDFFREIVAIGKDVGAKFAIGSDGHHPGQTSYGGTERLLIFSEMFDRIGLDEDDLFTAP